MGRLVGENIKKIILLFVLLLFCCVYLPAREHIDSTTSVKLLMLAKKYKYGINTDVNMKKAISIYKALTKSGNVEGMRELGRIYLKGDSVKRNYRAAYKLFQMAADAGDVKSLCALADMYREGKGVRMNYYEAFHLYQKAADKGSSRGLYGMGYCFYKGMGVVQSYEQAIKFLKLGSLKGNSACDMLLGNYYSHGYMEGCPNYEEAKKYYKQAVIRGNGRTFDIAKQGVLDSVKNINIWQKTKWKDIKSLYYLNEINHGFSGKKLMTRTKYNVNGSYSGKLYKYDWSGKYVEEEKNVSLDLLLNDSILSFNCYTDGTIFTKYVSDEYSGERWVKNELREDEMELRFVPIIVDVVSVNQDSLSILMEGMRPKNKDKMKPMLAVLKRDLITSMPQEASVDVNDMNVLLDDRQLVLSFNAQNIAEVTIELYTIDGIKVFETKKKTKEGNNSYRFDINISSGAYVLKISSNGIKYSKSVVYEN